MQRGPRLGGPASRDEGAPAADLHLAPRVPLRRAPPHGEGCASSRLGAAMARTSRQACPLRRACISRWVHIPRQRCACGRFAPTAEGCALRQACASQRGTASRGGAVGSRSGRGAGGGQVGPQAESQGPGRGPSGSLEEAGSGPGRELAGSLVAQAGMSRAGVRRAPVGARPGPGSCRRGPCPVEAPWQPAGSGLANPVRGRQAAGGPRWSVYALVHVCCRAARPPFCEVAAGGFGDAGDDESESVASYGPVDSRGARGRAGAEFRPRGG